MAEDKDNKSLIPAFIIHLNGNKFTNEQQAAVKQIVIEERIDAPSRFSITMTDNTRQWTDSEDMSDGSEVKIQIGYKDELEEIIYGEILGVQVQFRNNADQVAVIKGQNHLHRLCRGKKTRSFTEMSDVDIIKQIAGEGSLKCEIDDIGTDHLFLLQHDQTNYEYIMDMARKYDCRVYVKDKVLYFKKTEDSSQEEIVFEWGKTLSEFDAESDTTHLLTSVEVRGWDNDKGEAIVGNATMDDVEKKIGGDNMGGKYVKEKFGEAKHIHINEQAIDQDGADELARGMIANNSMRFITGVGKSEGSANVRAGVILELKELGGRFSGKYYVTSVRHVIDSVRGYATQFHICRNTD